VQKEKCRGEECWRKIQGLDRGGGQSAMSKESVRRCGGFNRVGGQIMGVMCRLVRSRGGNGGEAGSDLRLHRGGRLC